MNLDADFWTKRYRDGATGWDAGAITTPLKAYFDQLTDKQTRILIPGAGNSYEAEYLFKTGFQNVFVIDLSREPLNNLRQRVPDLPQEQLIEGDFFDHSGQYDLIVEQTFFCAIDPSLRQRYAEKTYELLRSGGKLVGVLFDEPLNNDYPPFGGNAAEYRAYFEPLFDFKVFETCYNSIPPRAGRELFIHLTKKEIISSTSV
ncbi:methyltransferase domain-containing protein [uncultured Imperialibacter sp.]|mgnify:CR=1 FL=1|uniref:methyltransferase domain-containing protein n=1 Tax=uncultured Imperialibacter sp. TaxID=1672639 RepID=UPI0030DD767F|tara:strand:+ start:76545 stop:77150 length:606 start_codon:yes stop_codon:yes gene_type:complete